MLLDDITEIFYPLSREGDGIGVEKEDLDLSSGPVRSAVHSPELDLMTANLWQLPRPFSAHNYKRLDRFVEYVNFHKPDVIALQELWMTSAIDYLRERLDYHCIASDGWLGKFNRTGLAMFLRDKPISGANYSFSQGGSHNFVESLAAKGYQKAKVQLNGHVVTVLNAHLYNPTRPFENRITINQFRKLKEAAEGDTILMGDLNLSWGNFIEQNNGFFQHDGNDELTLSRKNMYQNMRFNYFMESGFKDDYIVLRPVDMEVAKWQTQVIRKPLMSDHYAVRGRITLAH